jgi:hypothetical protein
MGMFRKKEKKPAIDEIKRKEMQEEVDTQRKFISEIIYPFLVENCKDIVSSQKLCELAVNEIRVGYDNFMSKMFVFDLNIENKYLDVPDENLRKMIIALRQQPIGRSIGMLQGMKQAIDWLVNQQKIEKSLKELIPNTDILFPTIKK